MGKRKETVAEWSTAATARQNGGRSGTLSYPKAMRDDVHEFMKLKASGSAPQPFTQFIAEFLLPKYNYTLSDQSFTRYVRKYESELWLRIKKNER